jgi:glycosyltransferase involved in cell wall biosynthesis
VNHPKSDLGGAQRQSLAIAKWLKRKGIDVSLITMTFDTSATILADNGVRLRQIGQEPRPGTFRLFDSASLLKSLYLAIVSENADVYYQRTTGVFTGLAAFACGSIGKPLVFGSSHIQEAIGDLSSEDFGGGSAFLPPKLQSALYRYGLSKACVIVSQTEEIGDLFRKRYPRKDVRHIPPLVLAYPPSTPKSADPFVFYLCRLMPFKRPLLFVRLAKALPNIRFVLAGHGPMEPQVRAAASGVQNLTYLGMVPPEESLELTSMASLFVNTSESEGFPNTLLEAGSCGTPYVSFYDPDEIICRYTLGAHVSSFDELVTTVEQLMKNSNLREEAGRNISEYVRTYHDPDRVCNAYERLFIEKARRV